MVDSAGEVLRLLGREAEARGVYEAAVQRGLWRHPSQRPREEREYWPNLESWPLPSEELVSRRFPGMQAALEFLRGNLSAVRAEFLERRASWELEEEAGRRVARFAGRFRCAREGEEETKLCWGRNTGLFPPRSAGTRDAGSSTT